MRNELKSLGYTDGPQTDRLILTMAALHEIRLSTKTIRTKGITRPTALVAASIIDPRIEVTLANAGLDWKQFRSGIGLETLPDITFEQDVAVDPDLHRNLETALRNFRSDHPEITEFNPLTLSLAAVAMAAEDQEQGMLGKRLRSAQGISEKMPTLLLDLMQGAPARPNVWLLQHKDQDRPAPLLMERDPGPGIAWRSTKTVKGIMPGDPVIYWRDIKDEKDDRGGLVGTGWLLSSQGRSETETESDKMKTKVWNYYPTRFVEIYPRDALARDPLIDATGLDMNWSLGSIQQVPPEMADQVDDYLKSHGRIGLFPGPGLATAAEITFIDDAPQAEDDLLGRAEIAFVLAARLNQIWDEQNPAPKADSGKIGLSHRIGLKGLFRLHRKRNAPPEAGFVVHVDAPWGGGKTTFANYLTRILNPYRDPGPVPDWLAALPLNDARFWPKAFRRPWHVVTFNAWQNQHVSPPWWCFYQAIRQQCFHAIRTETFAAQVAVLDRSEGPTVKPENQGDAAIPMDPVANYGYRDTGRRWACWFLLWLKELTWRLFNPKVRALLTTFAFTLVVAMILHRYDLFKPEALMKAFSASAKLPDILATGLTILFGGATAIWTVFATVTETLIPGTPSAAKNYSLGSGDPLARFRDHFNRMICSLERPVVVVIDDIDRCEPNFVVELVRGIQTIFKSSRVVFIVLGDRDWIEHAFSNVHGAMKGINVGPEHTFGARFVEKAIQLSLVLPDIPAVDRTSYVGTLLRIDATEPKIVAEALTEERKNIESEVDAILTTADPLARDASAKSLRNSIDAESNSAEPAQQTAMRIAMRNLDRQLALRSAADKRVRAATQHRLVPIAPVLPPNPRQIKRIINSVSLFQEIARMVQGVQPGTMEWRQLVIWVVLMTEFPQTWLRLSTYPGLMNQVHNGKGSKTGVLPENEIATEWTESIRSNPEIMQLIDFQTPEWHAKRINAHTIEWLRKIMPATSGELFAEPGKENAI